MKTLEEIKIDLRDRIGQLTLVPVSDTESLQDQRLDSLDIVELMMDLEYEHRFEYADTQEVYENFLAANINTLAEEILKKQGQADAP